jgi:hypothetical protein
MKKKITKKNEQKSNQKHSMTYQSRQSEKLSLTAQKIICLDMHEDEHEDGNILNIE